VTITASGPVALRHPHVVSQLNPPSLDLARLTVAVDLQNASDEQVTGTLRAKLLGRTVETALTLSPGESTEAVFSPDQYKELIVKDPKLWWPWHYGEQNLHDLEIEFVAGGQVSDRARTRFGIREVESEFTENDDMVIVINGRRVLIRGAGWAPDMLFRSSPERLAAEIGYVRHMNMNAIRLEGKHEVDRFYELCDEMGIMVIAGWCCCHHWERWHYWDAEDHVVAEASQRDQVKRVRSHASMVLWMNGSDNPPPPDVESYYLETLEDLRWPAAVVSSATEAPAKLSGPSGVKMNGPYEYVPPLYWYEDVKHGGAWGFNTETSPGPAVPPIESMRAMLPEDELWPIDSHWNYHAGRNIFSTIGVYAKAQDERYGRSQSALEFTMKSQAMTYELQRSMMGAFGREKYRSTGVIQWMLNDAWPSIIWHLYDYYLRPAGGYFGTRKACEPLHIQYSYDDRSVVVVNSRLTEERDLMARATVYNLDMSEAWSMEAPATAGPDESVRVLDVPEPDDFSETYFLKLELKRKSGDLVSDNFYWLSTTMDVLNWPATQWYYTPSKTFADYTALNDLPEVGLEMSATFGQSGDRGRAMVKVRNPTGDLAFLVRLKVTAGPGGDEVLPVFWDDNYFALLPGEERVIGAEYKLKDLGGIRPAVEVSGWNVAEATYYR